MICNFFSTKIANDFSEFDIFYFEENSDPSALLNAFNGWDDYTEITKEHYNSLANLK